MPNTSVGRILSESLSAKGKNGGPRNEVLGLPLSRWAVLSSSLQLSQPHDQPV